MKSYHPDLGPTHNGATNHYEKAETPNSRVSAQMFSSIIRQISSYSCMHKEIPAPRRGAGISLLIRILYRE